MLAVCKAASACDAPAGLLNSGVPSSCTAVPSAAAAAAAKAALRDPHVAAPASQTNFIGPQPSPSTMSPRGSQTSA